jgi:hypothetical protein
MRKTKLASSFGFSSLLSLLLGWSCVSHGDALPVSPSLEPSRDGLVHVLPGGSLELRSPSSQALLIDLPSYQPPELQADEVGLFALQQITHVYMQPAPNARTVGLVRRGTMLRARDIVAEQGCPRGVWYALADKGYACAGRGFIASPKPLTRWRQPRPDIRKALPFNYAKVTSRDALRYHRLPSGSELEAIHKAKSEGGPLPDVVRDRLEGDYFLALDGEETTGNQHFYRTVLGRYVKAENVAPRSAPKMQGELLGPETPLPIAFVYAAPSAPLLGLRDGHSQQLGNAHKHARFEVADDARWDGRQVVISREGYAVERSHVRIARRHARPKGVDRAEKWLHVDLAQQTLVAYRGDQPVFATLISSGRQGYETPPGLFRIHEKHKTTTMRGSDSNGVFEVSEVPWTMFYRGSYALHGAYWHDDFGTVRSHGCINIAPIDARWLFQFTEGSVPVGWHALRHIEGTRILVTQES